MAITITKQPLARTTVSTLLPIFFECSETTANTTNLVAKCFWVDQTTATETQIGGSYRLAPNLENADIFYFDASEIFNTLTKYTLNDMPNIIMGEDVGTYSDNIQSWADVATFEVLVKFYREYIDSVTGLIVLDTTPEDSNTFTVHEGCPDQKWLTSVVKSNGINESTFKYFQFDYVPTYRQKRWMTNYPMVHKTGDIQHYVEIGLNESYIVNFLPTDQSYCGYKLSIKTYDSSDTLLNTHEETVAESTNLHTALVGFRDIRNGLTASVAEGTDFEDVAYYTVKFLTGTNITAPCVYANISTVYKFTVRRKCNGEGYLRFAFKNMLGGWDMWSSRGEYVKKAKMKFSKFEKSLGYEDWTNSMLFGHNNWATEQVEEISVTTQPMRDEYAQHAVEMMSSTDTYIRVTNDWFDKVDAPPLDALQDNYPYFFQPIQIKSSSVEVFKTSKNVTKIKFSFVKSVDQRLPRN